MDADISSRVRNDKFFVFAVPVLLCVVAAIQLVFVDNHFLSRWKGGGFGMFSTVDSPSARFLRIYVETDTGEVPVIVPRDLGKLSRKVRVMPSQQRLQEFSSKLLEGTWVPLTMVSASQHYIDMLRAAGNEFHDTADDIQFQTRNNLSVIDFGKMQLIRMLSEDDPPVNYKRIPVKKVRVEVWKYIFERRERVLRAEKITQWTVKSN